MDNGRRANADARMLNIAGKRHVCSRTTKAPCWRYHARPKPDNSYLLSRSFPKGASSHPAWITTGREEDLASAPSSSLAAFEPTQVLVGAFLRWFRFLFKAIFFPFFGGHLVFRPVNSTEQQMTNQEAKKNAAIFHYSSADWGSYDCTLWTLPSNKSSTSKWSS